MRSLGFLFIFLMFAIGVLFVSVPVHVVYADGLVPCGTGSDPGAAEECGFNSFIGMLKAVMDYALFVIIMPLAALGIAWQGGMMMFQASQGKDPAEARGLLGNIILGVAIALGAWLLINTLIGGLGVSDIFNSLKSTWGK